tara:strand:- start:23251 stop:25542 length:2292 start_codon:yes stop_codon:yes gene_type:complete
MGVFDLFRRKDVSSESLQGFHAASVNVPQTSPLGRRPHMRDLAARYGMLVHRCVAINAQTAASITPRLFAIGNASTLTKAKGLNPKPISDETKAYMRGQMSCSPSASVLRKIKGNTENVVELESHPFLDLLEDVNDQTEGVAFRESFYSDLQIFGRNFTLLVRDNSKQPTSMWRLLPQIMNIVPGKEQFISHYEYGDGADKIHYSAEDVFWVHLYDPSDPYGGVGPLEAWLQTVDSQFANAAFIDNMYRKGGAPDYVLMAKGGMSTEQKRSFRAEFRRLFGRMVNRQDTIAIMSGDADLKPLQRPPRELQTVEQEQYTIEALAMAFGVPKSLLTTDDVNLANAREGSITHARNTILPMLRRFEDAVNQRLLPLWSDRLFLMHDNPVREDREIRIHERASQLGAGYTVNEIRLADDMEPLDDPSADTPMIASNLIPLGAPQVDEQQQEVLDEATKTYSWSDYHTSDCGCGDCETKDFEPTAGEDYRTSFANGVQGVLAQMIDEVIEALPASKSAVDRMTKASASSFAMAGTFTDVINIPMAQSELEAIGLKEIGAAMGKAGNEAVREIQSSIEGVPKFDIQDENVRDVLRKSTLRMAKDVSVVAQRDIRERIAKEMDHKDGWSIDSISEKLTNMRKNRPGTWSANRAKLVARTETAIAQNEGSLQGWKQTGVVKGKKFFASYDACEICKKVAREAAEVPFHALDANFAGDEIKYEDASGQDKVFKNTYRPLQTPPVHPNCTCSMKAVTYSMSELADRAAAAYSE